MLTFGKSYDILGNKLISCSDDTKAKPMTPKAAAASVLESIRMDIARATRPAVIAEEFHASLERAGVLFLAGLWFESRNVATQAREMEGTQG